MTHDQEIARMEHVIRLQMKEIDELRVENTRIKAENTQLETEIAMIESGVILADFRKRRGLWLK